MTDTTPRKHRTALMIWIGVYPVLTLTSWLLEPLLSNLATPLRTLVMSIIMVPAMVYIIIPFLQRAASNTTAYPK